MTPGLVHSVFAISVTLLSVAWLMADRFKVKGPTDQELITTFEEHREVFWRLQQMASEDVQHGWYFNAPYFQGSAPDESRRQEYSALVSKVPHCLRVDTDYDGHMRFCFAGGGAILAAISPGWVKGIEFWPQRCPWVMLNTLDHASTLAANVYARQIEPHWFVFYQRDD
jgi:hypothetical protein